MRRGFVPGAMMVIGAASLWGSLGVFARYLFAAGLTPVEQASIRASVAFVGLAIWLAPRMRRLRVGWRDALFLAVHGIVGFALFELLYFATVQRTTVAVAVALLYTAPAFVLLMSLALVGRRPRGVQLSALGLVLAGVFLVTGALTALLSGSAPVSRIAVVLGLGSGLTYGLYTVLGKISLRRHDPVRTVFYTMGFAALALGAFAPPWRVVAQHLDVLPWLLAIGLFPTLLAFLLYVRALLRLEASEAAMLATIEPVVAALLGALLLHERLGADQLVGVALIAAAALLLAREAGAER